MYIVDAPDCGSDNCIEEMVEVILKLTTILLNLVIIDLFWLIF